MLWREERKSKNGVGGKVEGLDVGLWYLIIAKGNERKVGTMDGKEINRFDECIQPKKINK